MQLIFIIAPHGTGCYFLLWVFITQPFRLGIKGQMSQTKKSRNQPTISFF